MIYQFDTNIVVHYLRESEVMYRVEQMFDPFNPANEIWICVVSLGELKSMAIQAKWGAKRLRQLETLLDILNPIDAEDILDRYAEIDAFSQNKLPTQPLSLTARNMGKNDLWIAATASILDAQLLTTDFDFDHLNGVFLNVGKV
ncbi:MAG: PIN domain-containing protein [Saprospiraceae bacterium]|nr:PIN domain-containing protein [Saprospiraceae bacterium]